MDMYPVHAHVCDHACEHVLCGYVCAMYAHVCCVCVDEKVSVGVLLAARVYTVLLLIQI